MTLKVKPLGCWLVYSFYIVSNLRLRFRLGTPELGHEHAAACLLDPGQGLEEFLVVI